MSAATGQGGGARLRRWIGGVLAVLVVATLVGMVRLAWGKLDVTWLVRHVAAHTIGGAHLTVARASLFWDRRTTPSALVLTLRGPLLRRDDGSVAAQFEVASVGVRPGALLIGRVRPLFVTAQAGSVGLARREDGSIGLDATAKTGGGAGKLLSQLRQVTLHGIDVVVADERRHALWTGRIDTLHADHIDDGRLAGGADVDLRTAGQSTHLAATLAQAPTGPKVVGTLSPFNPARLAGISPLAAASGLDLTISAGFQLQLDPHWQPLTAAVTLQFGPGRAVLGSGTLPIDHGTARIEADFGARRARLVSLRLALAMPGPTITATGSVAWAGTRANAALAADVDRVEFAQLARYWPAGIAPGGRAWVTGNVTAGIVSSAHVEIGLGIADGRVSLSGATGHLEARDLTVWWERPVPPLVHGAATLTVQSPDAMLISVTSAQQTPSDRGNAPLMLTRGSLRITGLTAPDQIGMIEADLSGPVPQAIALLGEPRLHLLSNHPLALGVPGGTIATHLQVRLPLDDKVGIDQVGIHAAGQLEALHLGGIIGGRDLDQGQLALDVSQAGLSLKGTAQLAGVPSSLAVTMDFRAGPPGQTITSYGAKGSATAAQLQQAGLPALGLVDGSLVYAASVEEHRDGSGLARVHVDLRDAGLQLTALGWQKPHATDSVADATVRLDHDHIVGVDQLSVIGPGVSVHGRASYQAGKPVSLDFDHFVLGRTEANGALRFPTASDPALLAQFRGRMLDLSVRMKPGPGKPTPGRAEARAAARQRHIAAAQAPRGEPWRADLHFDQVLLGPDHSLADVSARAQNDGVLIQHADVTGTAGKGRFHMVLAPAGQGRTLHGTAQDAGGLLHALDLASDVAGGTLSVDASYDDTQPDHPLAGTTLVDRFRIIGAPAVARLLQAMTLYGVVDVLRGPGLGITHLVAPFRFADQVLSLDNARAFSGSLGFTSKGDIDLAAQRADLTGTIVPAYFFNTMLGKIPLVGKLFSPEPGGGVFAATYSLAGPLANPKVAVNPLAALTPGALRGLFGVFDTQQGTSTTAPVPAAAPRTR